MVVVIPVEIIAVLKAMKNEFSDTFTWRQINITSNRNGMLSAGLTFLWQEQDFFFGRIIIVVSHTVYSKDKFLKRSMTIESFFIQPVIQSVK